MIDVVGVLLTGGSSRRMGVDKASLRVGAQTLAQRAAARLAEVCEHVIEVGPGHSGYPSVLEQPRGSGPLNALATGAALRPDAAHLVLGVDMPAIETSTLRLIARHAAPESVVPKIAGRSQLVCARWSPAACARARELVAAGETSLRALEESTAVVYLCEADLGGATAESFADVDEPSDLDVLRRLESDSLA